MLRREAYRGVIQRGSFMQRCCNRAERLPHCMGGLLLERKVLQEEIDGCSVGIIRFLYRQGRKTSAGNIS